MVNWSQIIQTRTGLRMLLNYDNWVAVIAEPDSLLTDVRLQFDYVANTTQQVNFPT
jgi:hypothetical protein